MCTHVAHKTWNFFPKKYSFWELVLAKIAKLIDISWYIGIWSDISRYIAIYHDILIYIAIYWVKNCRYNGKKTAYIENFASNISRYIAIYRRYVEIYQKKRDILRYIVIFTTLICQNISKLDISRKLYRYIMRYQ